MVYGHSRKSYQILISLLLMMAGCSPKSKDGAQAGTESTAPPGGRATKVSKYDEVRVKIDIDLQSQGALASFISEAQPRTLELHTKRMSSALNELLITRPYEEDEKKSALLQFSSEADTNSKFDHFLFWPDRWERVEGASIVPRGLVVIYEQDDAKADLKLYATIETSRKHPDELAVIVQPPEDRADYQCRRTVTKAEVDAGDVRASEIIAACALSIVLRSKTDPSDPRNAVNRTAYRLPYSLYLGEPIPGGQDRLLVGIVEYTKYIRTRIDPNSIPITRITGQQALSNAVSSLFGADESTPLRSYLFTHASVTLCEEQGRSCVHEDVQKNDAIKQALNAPIFQHPGAWQTKALAEEMMAEFDEAAKIWTQIAQSNQPMLTQDRLGTLSRQSNVKKRIADRKRESGGLWAALILHSQVLRDLTEQPTPPWNQAEQQGRKGLKSLEENTTLEVATDKLRIAELAKTLARLARDHRAIVDFRLNEMRQIFAGILVEGDKGPAVAPGLSNASVVWAAQKLLPLKTQHSCVDQVNAERDLTRGSCYNLRRQIELTLSEIAMRYQAEALTALNGLLASAKAVSTLGSGVQPAAARQRDLQYRVYLVACRDRELWNQEGVQLDASLAHLAQTTLSDAERKKMIVALSRCRMQSLLRDTAWPRIEWLTETAAALHKVAQLHDDLVHLRRQGEEDMRPVLNLLHYPALWRAVDAYVKWVQGHGDELEKQWGTRAAKTQDYSSWDDDMKQMWDSFVNPSQAKEAIRAIKESLALDRKEPRLTEDRSNLLDLTGQTFFAWAQTQPSLGTARSSMFEAMARAEIARAGLLKKGFEDLRDTLEPLMRDLEELRFATGDSSPSDSDLAFNELDERIAGATVLSFLRIYDVLESAGKMKVPAMELWLSRKHALLGKLINKVQENAVERWQDDNRGLLAILEKDWEDKKGSRLVPAELKQRREAEAKAVVFPMVRNSLRIEQLARGKEQDVDVSFHHEPFPDQSRNKDSTTAVRTTQAAARIIAQETHCDRGLQDQTPQQRLGWFLAHVGLHKERYVGKVLPDGIRSETLSLARAYEEWCTRNPQSEDLLLSMARQLKGYFTNPPGERSTQGPQNPQTVKQPALPEKKVTGPMIQPKGKGAENTVPATPAPPVPQADDAEQPPRKR